jgi:hypothetical protein
MTNTNPPAAPGLINGLSFHRGGQHHDYRVRHYGALIGYVDRDHAGGWTARTLANQPVTFCLTLRRDAANALARSVGVSA